MSTEPEITMKNTKAEMLEALNAALLRSETAEKNKLNPEKIEKEKTEKRAVESAKASVEKNIFSEELNNKFKDLQVAIATEQTRLQELYGISEELQKLVLVIEAGRERQAQIEFENNEKTTEAKSVIEKLRIEYTEKKNELQEEYESAVKKQKTERTREVEEYQYNLKRDRDKENNAWEDEKATRESILAKKEEQAQDILEEAEAKEQYIKGLEARVEEIPDLIEREIKSALDRAIAELTKETEYRTALAEKDSQSIQSRQNDNIAHLEKELASSNKTNADLQNKLEKAYVELRELATKTVESASGVKIIGGSGDRVKE